MRPLLGYENWVIPVRNQTRGVEDMEILGIVEFLGVS